MKNIFIAILFLSVVICFAQNKTVVKKEPDNKAVLTPVKVNPDNEPFNGKGDAEVPLKKEITDYSQIFEAVEMPAHPVEGMNVFRKKIANLFRLPEVDDAISATIIVKFVVWDDGSIRDIRIIKEQPQGLGLGKEAIRVLQTSENWIPGQINGKNVKQYYTFPLKIQIPAFEESSQPIEEIKAKSESNLSKENNEEAIIRQYGNQPEESSTDQSPDYSQIFTSVHEQAVPPGGMNAFRKFIASSFILPEVAEKITGTVVAKFVVWDDGSIKDVQIIKETPANLGLGKEAIRVISSSEKWIPGKYNDRKVKQYYTMPISIQIVPSEKVVQPVKENDSIPNKE